jgi:hypothetical protein
LIPIIKPLPTAITIAAHQKRIRKIALRIVAVASLISLTSCGANQVLSQLEQDDTPPLNLSYNVLETKILDYRDSISEGEIQLPFISKPNLIIEHVPALTETHHEVIANTIAENTSGTGIPIKVVVTLMDGYQKFSATWTSEREMGFARIQITLLDGKSGKMIASCDSSGEVFIQSIDSSQKRMEEIYQLTLKSVTKKCLRSIHEGLNPQPSKQSVAPKS